MSINNLATGMASLIRSSIAAAAARFVLSLFFAAVLVEASTVTSTVVGRFELSGTGVSPSSLRLVVNGGERVFIPFSDGTFALDDLSPGTHIVEIASVELLFPVLRIDVSSKVSGKVRVAHSLNSKRQLTPPLVLEPLDVPSYYEKRPVWSLDVLFKNKMLLMLAVMMGGALLLPKMMANIDPEEMKKMQQEMQSMPNLASVLSGNTNNQAR